MKLLPKDIIGVCLDIPPLQMLIHWYEYYIRGEVVFVERSNFFPSISFTFEHGRHLSFFSHFKSKYAAHVE